MPGEKYGHSVAASGALTNAYAAFEVKAVSGTDAHSDPVPNHVYLSWLHGQLDTIAGGATTVTWFLSLDAAGDIALTEELTETILVGQTTATDGSVVSLLEKAWSLPGAGTQGSLWLYAKLDVGTANLIPRLFWQREG